VFEVFEGNCNFSIPNIFEALFHESENRKWHKPSILWDYFQNQTNSYHIKANSLPKLPANPSILLGKFGGDKRQTK